MSSALEGLRVLELPGERTAFAGKLLADMGADVIVVEPPAGDATRSFAPFVIRDHNLITGQNPASSELAARRVLEALEQAERAD